MKYYYTTYPNGKIHKVSTSAMVGFSEIETDVDLEHHNDSITIVGGIIKDIGFPYANEDRNIRVEVTHKQVTEFTLNPMIKPLIDWAVGKPYIETENSIIIYLRDFQNDLMGEEETEQLLINLNVDIKRNENI
jgi:hypothetical protein